MLAVASAWEDGKPASALASALALQEEEVAGVGAVVEAIVGAVVGAALAVASN